MQISIQAEEPRQVAGDPELVVELGDVVTLTLGDGGTGREDKRRQYN